MMIILFQFSKAPPFFSMNACFFATVKGSHNDDNNNNVAKNGTLKNRIVFYKPQPLRCYIFLVTITKNLRDDFTFLLCQFNSNVYYF